MQESQVESKGLGMDGVLSQERWLRCPGGKRLEYRHQQQMAQGEEQLPRKEECLSGGVSLLENRV